MLKKVDSSQLKVGMYVHDLSCDWMTHPFVRNRFLLRSDDEIRKIVQAGIHDVVIDSGKGLDVQDAPTVAQARAETERELVQIAAAAPQVVTRVSLGMELARATQVRRQAASLVRTVMADVRLGKAVELDRVQHTVQDITESILRNPGALVGLLRIKNKDDYTFLHSVSVCALLVAFCRSRGLEAAATHQAGRLPPHLGGARQLHAQRDARDHLRRAGDLHQLAFRLRLGLRHGGRILHVETLAAVDHHVVDAGLDDLADLFVAAQQEAVAHERMRHPVAAEVMDIHAHF